MGGTVCIGNQLIGGGGTVCIGNQLIGGYSMYREPVDWGGGGGGYSMYREPVDWGGGGGVQYV